MRFEVHVLCACRVYVHKDVVIDRAFVIVTSILHISGRKDIIIECMRAVGMPMPICS